MKEQQCGFRKCKRPAEFQISVETTWIDGEDIPPSESKDHKVIFACETHRPRAEQDTINAVVIAAEELKLDLNVNVLVHHLYGKLVN